MFNNVDAYVYYCVFCLVLVSMCVIHCVCTMYVCGVFVYIHVGDVIDIKVSL